MGSLYIERCPYCAIKMAQWDFFPTCLIYPNEYKLIIDSTKFKHIILCITNILYQITVHLLNGNEKNNCGQKLFSYGRAQCLKQRTKFNLKSMKLLKFSLKRITTKRYL